MELDLNGPDASTIIPFLIRRGLVTDYTTDALIGQIRAASKTALIGPILDALYETRPEDVRKIVDALNVDSLPLIESLAILPEVRMTRLLSFLREPESNEQAICGAIRRILDRSHFSTDYLIAEHAKLSRSDLGPLVYLTLFDAMGANYAILDRLLMWLCSAQVPTRKIAQNLLYRAIQAGLGWVNEKHGTELVALCQVLEENQQHIVAQHHHDWTFAEWDAKLRNCAIKRAFNHENKKVTSSLFRRIMGSLKLVGDELIDVELLEVIVRTSTNLYLYRGDHSAISTFMGNNAHLGSALLVALSKQAQSAECLYIWTAALFHHAVWDEKSGVVALEACQNISRQIQETHQIQLRSGTTSLLVQLAVRIQSVSGTSIYFKTLSIMRLRELTQSDSSNISGLLKAHAFPAEETIDFSQLNAAKARQVALSCVYGSNGSELFDTFCRQARSAFDQMDLDRAHSSIRVLLELDQFATPFDAHLAVSFFEFLFCAFDNEHGVEMGNFTAQLAIVCLNHLTNDNMKRLTRDKIITLALSNLSTPASAAFSLAMLTSVKMELTRTDKIVSFAAGQNFSPRPRPDQMRQMMTSAWTIIGSQLAKVENLVEMANDALPRLEADGQFIILSAVKGEQAAELLETAWAAVKGANERVHDIYHAYLDLLIESALTVDQFEYYVDEIFELAARKSGMILPLVNALAKSAWDFDQMESSIMKIIFYEVAKCDRLEDVLIDECEQLADVVDIVTDVTRQVEQDECEMLRLEVLRLLKMKTTNRLGLMEAVVKRVNRETQDNPKYFVDSHTHRFKERAWQVVLFLLTEADFASKITTDQAKPLFEMIVKVTINDEQTSVSALQQLCLVQLLHGHSELHAQVLDVIDAFGDEQNTGQSISVSGMLLVSFLFGMDNNNEFLLNLVPVVLRLQQSNNYVVRIYAIGLSAAILSYFEQRNTDELDTRFPFFTEHVAFWRRVSNGNVGKNVARVLANPFVSGRFTVPRDLTLGAIMRTMLKLNGSQGAVSLSALQRVDHFEMAVFSEFDGEAEVDQSKAAKVLAVQMDNHNDAQQQKIAPWMNSEQSETKKDGLVVCCSLLDKANNLGGITRTAEIFGATELIFDNLNVLNDKNYTALAVTGKIHQFQHTSN